MIGTIFPAMVVVGDNGNIEDNIIIKEDFVISPYAIYDEEHFPSLETDDTSNMVIVSNFGNGDQLDQQQTGNCGYGWNIRDDQWIAQGFIPSMKNLTRVELYLFKAGEPPENIQFTVSIRSLLEGSDLISKSVDASSVILSGPSKWYEFDFQDIELTVGNKYYIVCRADGGWVHNCYCWVYDDDNPYEYGSAWSSFNHGESWHYVENDEHKDTDCCFKTYGTNLPPFAPAIVGNTLGKVGEEQYYTFCTTDPDGEDVYFSIEWDDGSKLEWIGPFESYEEEIQKHTWENQGTYSIRAKAKDIHDTESDWATLEVSMPRNKPYTDRPFFNFLENYLNMFPILRRLLPLIN